MTCMRIGDVAILLPVAQPTGQRQVLLDRSCTGCAKGHVRRAAGACLSPEDVPAAEVQCCQDPGLGGDVHAGPVGGGEDSVRDASDELAVPVDGPQLLLRDQRATRAETREHQSCRKCAHRIQRSLSPGALHRPGWRWPRTYAPPA